MRVEHVNPFVTATRDLFSTMLGISAKRSRVSLGFHRGTPCDVSALIRLTGGASGVAVLSMPEKAAIDAASKFAGKPLFFLDDEVRDAIGELANIIVGNAKVGLESQQITISPPEIVIGRGAPIPFPEDCQPLQISFDSDVGPLFLLAGITYGASADQGLSQSIWASGERRDTERHGFRQKVAVSYWSTGAPRRDLLADTLDISTDGVSFLHRGMIFPQTPCEVTITGEDGRKFRAKGKVARSEYQRDMVYVISAEFDKPIDLSRVFALPREKASA